MKHFSLVSMFILALTLSGCVQKTAPLPAGAADLPDATANEILQPAHAFAAKISAAVQSTDPQVHIVLTPAQLTVLNKLNASLNVADGLEIAYHAHPVAANAAALNTSTATVQQNLSAAQSIITVPLK